MVSFVSAQHRSSSEIVALSGRTLRNRISESGGASSAAFESAEAPGLPHYSTRSFSTDDSTALRRAFGITNPRLLYISDSTEEGILKYDTQRKPCRTCYVNSYRVGYVSVRRPGESWEHVERRVGSSRPSAFGEAPVVSTSTANLDPDVRPLVEAMLRDAVLAGFKLHMTSTYRSPLREAFLMAEGGGRTHTLTSNHSYGRAVDIVIDDGNRSHAQTRQDWIAFRRWVTSYRTSPGESFRLLGGLDQSWDWAHVELPSATLRFSTIDDAITRARLCLAPGANTPCNFAPHLQAYLAHALVQ